MELRPYQKEAKEAMFEQWDSGVLKTLLVLPTGCGKTVVFAKVTEECVRKGDRVLILAHRGELLDQAADKLMKTTGLGCALEKAESSCQGSWFRVVVGSVQTLMREKRLGSFPADYFNTIIIDEAHHCISDSYQRVLQHFPEAQVLGVTATPDRGDMRNLGVYFESLAYEYTLPKAIKEGYLSPIKALTIPLKIDMSNVSVQAGDFKASEIGTALDPYLEGIAQEMQKNGGLISKEDLAAYKAVERTPISGDYRGYQVYSMPPPSSGGIHIVQILNILENFDMQKYGFGSADAMQIMAEAEKYAYADRSEYLGDPDFVKVPWQALTNKAYAKSIADQIDINKAKPSSEIRPGKLAPYESNQTTHYSVVDKDGNAVAVTYTLNTTFGTGIVAGESGILLNNQMDDFSAKPGVPNVYGLVGGDANAVGPNKRPLSSMSPTIVVKDGKTWLVTGSPGGSRIITTVLQMVVNSIDYGMNVAEATNAPRFHHQWLPDELRVEKGFSPDTIKLLEAKGQKVALKEAMGSTQSIMIGPDGELYGASDPRSVDDLTAGY